MDIMASDVLPHSDEPTSTPPPEQSTPSTGPARRLLWADGVCLLALLGFALAMVAPILTGGVPVATDTLDLWGPGTLLKPQPVHNSVLADSALGFLPVQVFIRRSLAAGEWPLWSPDQFAGWPLLGNSQSQLYYPVAWLLLLLPLAGAIQVGVVIHIWLAGAGMYILARLWGASRSGSLLAALTFAASGQFYMALELTSVVAIYPWLPWVVAAGEMAWRRRSWAWTAAAGLLWGTMAVAGHLPWFQYSAIFLALWFGGRVLGLAALTVRQGGWAALRAGRNGVWGQAGRVGGLIAWGPLLAAVHLLPFVELGLLSSRIGASFGPPAPLRLDVARAMFSQQVRLLVPQFLGTSVGDVGAPLLFGNCWYVGLAPLALAPLALLLRPTRQTWALGVVGVVALAVAAGLPLFDLLHRLPGLSAQPPQRTAYLFIFAAAALSGLGFDALLDLTRRHLVRAGVIVAGLTALAGWLASALGGWHEQSRPDPALYALQTAALAQAALIAAGLVGWGWLVVALRGDRALRGRAALAGVLLGVTAVDLLTYAPGYNTFVPPQTLQVQAHPAAVMLTDRTFWRMMGVANPIPMFVPNMATLYGLQDVQGYDSLHTKRYEQFWAAVDPTIEDAGYFSVIFRPQRFASAQANLLNVKYVVLAGSPLTVEQPDSHRTISELATRPVTQTFQTPANLSSVSVAFDTLGRVNHAPITLHIRRGLTATVDLVSKTVDPSGWTGRPWIEFKFPPLPVTEGEPLVLVIDAPGAREGDSCAVRVSAGDGYVAGTLYRVGQPRPFDLAFIARGTLGSLQLMDEGPVAVYRNTAALPRAFVAGGAAVLPPTDILARLAAPGFDPRRVVLLEQAPPPGFAAPSEAPPSGTATITSYRNLSVDVTAQMDRAGWLVLGDVNYPGWQVTVDGQDAPLYTAYALVRAVPLPAGTHQVHFYFRPLSALLGGVISLAALLVAVGVITGTYLRRGRRIGRWIVSEALDAGL